MSFKMSSELRATEIAVADLLTQAIDPAKGYSLCARNGEGYSLGMVYSYNLQYAGFPDLIMSGHSMSSAEHQKTVMHTLIADMLIRPMRETIEEFVDDINEGAARYGLGETYKAVAINTEQWMYGFGTNSQRFYSDIPLESMFYIQIVFSHQGMGFPTVSTNEQILLPTTPFGQKENTNEPVLSNTCISSIASSDRQGPVTRH